MLFIGNLSRIHNDGDFLGSLAVTFVLLIIFVIYNTYHDAKNKKREKKISNYADRKGLKYFPFYSKPLKGKEEMNCFSGMSSISFVNVIEKKSEKDNSVFYIGELQWLNPLEFTLPQRSRFDFFSTSKSDSNLSKTKLFTNMAVYIDDRLNLPDFDLMRETLAKKLVEVVKLNRTEDIDFDEDKEFSDAWWLSSETNMLVREFFTAEVRKKFMPFLDKNYRIVGRENTLIIIADKLYEPEKFIQIETDIHKIARFLSSNKI